MTKQIKYTQIALLTLQCLIASCGTDAKFNTNMMSCAPKGLFGHWIEPNTQSVLVLNDDCSATESSCNLAFDFQVQDSQNVIIHVSQSNQAPGCPNTGTSSCNYSLENSNQSLVLNCTGTAVPYVKQ